MNIFGKHACANTHIQVERLRQHVPTCDHKNYVHNEVEEDSTELKANLVLKESTRWEILFDNCFKTAYYCEGPMEPSRTTAPNKPLLQAQQTFSCFLFKGSHTNTLHSLPYQSSQTALVCVCVCVCACAFAWVSMWVCMFACAYMCLYARFAP